MKSKILISILLYSVVVVARDVKITEDLEAITVKDGKQKITIERIQDRKHRITSNFSKTSRECPPFCVQPMNIGKVKTIGELELLKYIQEMQKDDSNLLLIDARTRDWYRDGTIPTAINLPFVMLDKDSQYLEKILKLLGARKTGDKWNFNKVPKMIIFSNGIWDAQATKAIKRFIELGCPEDKIIYYRGGMQDWHILGLTIKK